MGWFSDKVEVCRVNEKGFAQLMCAVTMARSKMVVDGDS